MKKLLIIASLIIFPSLVFAQTFDSNLYFGLQNNSDVEKLQEFLTDQGVYSGPITGNFFSLTLAAVKKFQTQNNISPAAGFVGPLTRTKVNDVLSIQLNASNQQAVVETGTVAPVTVQNPTTDSNQQLIQNLQNQILAFQQQLTQMQQQNQTAQNQQTQIQSQQTQIQNQQTQIQQNQQNQISSIQQQQVNQQTNTTQPQSTPTSVPQMAPVLNPAYTKEDFVIGISAVGVPSDAYIPKVHKEIDNLVSQFGYINGIARIKEKHPKWQYILNGNIITDKVTGDIFTNGWDWGLGYYANLVFNPGQIYDYKLYYYEDGREKSEYSGTFIVAQ